MERFLATTNTKNERVDALAALARLVDRTGEAIDDFEAAGKLWEPGAHAAEGIAAYYRGMLPLLAGFKASAERGMLPESWKTAIDRYNAWYYDRAPEVDAAEAELGRLGVTCI